MLCVHRERVWKILLTNIFQVPLHISLVRARPCTILLFSSYFYYFYIFCLISFSPFITSFVIILKENTLWCHNSIQQQGDGILWYTLIYFTLFKKSEQVTFYMVHITFLIYGVSNFIAKNVDQNWSIVFNSFHTSNKGLYFVSINSSHIYNYHQYKLVFRNMFII